MCRLFLLRCWSGGKNLRIIPSKIKCESDFSTLNNLSECCIKVIVLLDYFDLLLKYIGVQGKMRPLPPHGRPGLHEQTVSKLAYAPQV